MLHRIVITKRAYAQFQSICEYLVDEFGECIADISYVTEGRFFCYSPLCTHESINQHVLKYSFQLLFC